MSGQTAKPFACVALLALISGANVALPANPARADDCRSAPNAPAPAGTHWYYRLDWATQRKCWYVRAPSRRASQATAAMMTPTTALRSAPDRSDPTSAIDAAPMLPSPGDVIPPSPRAEMSALRPISAPASSRTIDGAPGQSVLDGTTTPIEEAPAQQSGMSSETGTQAVAAGPPIASPDPPIAVASDKTRGSAATATRNYADVVPDEAENSARGGGPINNGATPMMIFPVLALGLALLGIGSRFLKKHAALRRAQIVMGETELDRANDQRRDGRDGPDLQESLVEEQEFHSFVSAVSDEGTLRADGDAIKIAREIGKRRHKLAQLRQNIEWMLRSVAGPYAEPRQPFGLPIAKSASWQQ
jgi:hypothetical protein